MSALCLSRRSTRMPGNAAVEFEHCLRCGASLRSWLARRDGFGLSCAEQLARPVQSWRRRLAVADARDLALLEQLVR